MSAMQGILLMAIGSLGASSFYVPFKKVKVWAWESYWIMQGVAAWLVAPLLFAWFTIPDGALFQVLADAPDKPKWLAIMFGALWGIGGLTFGLSIRYLGVALGQSIALGLTAAFGTLVPPMVNPDSSLSWVLILGVSICVAGIAVIGYAGALKNKSMTEEQRKAAVSEFALKKGILIAILAGVMSACFNFGLEAGKPIEVVAQSYGTNSLFLKNPTLVFILWGGFVTNALYCFFLNIKKGTYRDYFQSGGKVFFNNLFFTFLAGFLWFLQFHFLGMGQSKLPPELSVYGWSILMALNISFSNVWGIILKEWKGANRATMVLLVVGIIVLVASTFVVNIPS
ncbi:L-rhamnose/proton symporter RhaT [Marinilabilia salmonicolor]|uniref:L-rhamnose-H+ transport protein n=1 Tax=Marinilabilia salmonicolor TaxID=989 RepID=A0A368UUQ1_9BACT|nr:L-rhamnose/proton symporter RhaT [Marinilabilia salmonicolor]RCW32522.1 L-rhamnose-H+ transport protein [Marinilabilia salmonicolor]